MVDAWIWSYKANSHSMQHISFSKTFMLFKRIAKADIAWQKYFQNKVEDNIRLPQDPGFEFNYSSPRWVAHHG